MIYSKTRQVGFCHIWPLVVIYEYILANATKARMPGRELTAAELEQFRVEGYVIVRNAFSAARIGKLRRAVETVLDRAVAAEDAAAAAGDDAQPGEPTVSWINREKRLPARMGDWMSPAKYSPEFTDWLGEDAIPHLSQLIDGGQERGVRHCRFQMLAGGDGEAYRQGWHRDQRFVDPEGHFGQVCIDAGLAFLGRCVEWYEAYMQLSPHNLIFRMPLA